jgi:predicted lipoprotein with Yx(FWY)xxD motif
MRRMVMAVMACALVGACGGESAEPAPGGQEPAEEPPAIELRSSDFGEILVDPQGMTLYMFVPDVEKGGRPTCYEECADAWPALEATGEPTAGAGLKDSALGTVKRTDGTTQVTYNDLPLYLFSGDKSPGDTKGQSLNDVWWVVSPAGKPVRDKQPSESDRY